MSYTLSTQIFLLVRVTKEYMNNTQSGSQCESYDAGAEIFTKKNRKLDKGFSKIKSPKIS